MTNTLAVWIVLSVVGFFLIDAYVLQWGLGMLVARGFLELIHWLAFWR